MTPLIVTCGSAEYHDIGEFQHPFKLQMLHQAAVGRFSWNMLAARGCTNPSITVLVYYPRTVLDEYLNLLQHEHVSRLFKWFMDGAGDAGLTDAVLASRIPSIATKRSRVVLRSHIPLLRAFVRYAFARDDLDPVGPLHTLRPSVIAMYDIMKGSTDVECRAVADAWRGMTAKYSAATKYAIRMIYTVLVLAVKITAIYDRAEAVGFDCSKLPLDIYELRRLFRDRTSLNSRLRKLATALRIWPIPFGAARVPESSAALTALKSPFSYSSTQIVAVRQDAIQSVLQARAEREDRTLMRWISWGRQ